MLAGGSGTQICEADGDGMGQQPASKAAVLEDQDQREDSGQGDCQSQRHPARQSEPGKIVLKPRDDKCYTRQKEAEDEKPLRQVLHSAPLVAGVWFSLMEA